MGSGWILPDAVFDGRDLLPDTVIRIDGRCVSELRPRQQIADPVSPKRIKGIISPGFLDLQVNGGGGVLFNNDPSVAGFNTIAQAHRTFGTCAIMPTVITDKPEVLEAAADAAIAVKASPFFLGLHIEGPHISVAKRGTHNPRYIRALDQPTMTIVQTLRAHGVPVMITLAPEAVTVHQIAALSRMGAVVSLGHSAATSEQAKLAFAAGAQSVTHLFNAMSQMTGREAGLVGAALSGGAYAGVICDGVHVADQMIALAHRAAALPDRLYLVSDAMPTVAGPASFTLYGSEIRLQDGRLINSEGNLAGAHSTQTAGVMRLVGQVGLSVEMALRMAVTVPAQLAGAQSKAKLLGCQVDDVIWLDQDLSFQGYVNALQ